MDPASPGADEPPGPDPTGPEPRGVDRVEPGDWVVELSTGVPGRCLAVAIPVLAALLVGFRAATAGLARAADDPLPPAVLAVATIAGACLLGWRAWTQQARLDASGLRVRNLTVAFDLDWDQVERLRVERRLGLQVVEIGMRHLRRRHRLGAATRLVGPAADAVLVALGTHPRARRLLSTADGVRDGGDDGAPGDDVTGDTPGAP